MRRIQQRRRESAVDLAGRRVSGGSTNSRRTSDSLDHSLRRRSGGTGAGSDGSNPSPVLQPSTDPEETATPSAELPEDVSLVLTHADKKLQLHHELDLASEHLDILVAEAAYHNGSIEEGIKRSTVMRKVLLSVKEELRFARQRRDRLIRQRNEQPNPVLNTLTTRRTAIQSEVDTLERDVARKRQLVQLRQQKIEALREELEAAKYEAELEYRRNNRRLEATKTAAEMVDRSDRAAWLQSLGAKIEEPAAEPTARATVAALLAEREARGVIPGYEEKQLQDDEAAAKIIRAKADKLEAMVNHMKALQEQAKERVEQQKIDDKVIQMMLKTGQSPSAAAATVKRTGEDSMSESMVGQSPVHDRSPSLSVTPPLRSISPRRGESVTPGLLLASPPTGALQRDSQPNTPPDPAYFPASTPRRTPRGSPQPETLTIEGFLKHSPTMSLEASFGNDMSGAK